MFSDHGHQRRLSDASMQSTVSGSIDNIPLTTITNCEFSLCIFCIIILIYLLIVFCIVSIEV